MVNPDPRWMSFMWSYPNAIPVNAATVRHITGKLEPFAFDRMYGGWWDRVCATDAKARLHEVRRAIYRGYIVRRTARSPRDASSRAPTVLAG